jgi:tetratricopeptide (TPR) repeat protein
LHRFAPGAIVFLASTALASSSLLTAAAAKTQESLIVATPFEVGESPAGNYLAAVVAGAERDTVAAETFFREALRFDPRNRDLIERAFVASVSNGSMPEAFDLADRLIVRDPSNGLAHLALGVKAIKAGQYMTARAHFARGAASEPRDLTATLLTAWSYEGSGEKRKALGLIDQLNDDNFAIFRDYHKALVADVAGDQAQAARTRCGWWMPMDAS